MMCATSGVNLEAIDVVVRRLFVRDLETVAAVFFFAVCASSDDGNTLGLAAVWVVFAVLFFYLVRQDAG